MKKRRKMGKTSDPGVKEQVVKCPEPGCKSNLKLRDSKYGIFYGCPRWPDCDGKHGAHQATGEPLGIPATKETREARIQAHAEFDKLWLGPKKVMSRRDAYKVMAEEMGMDKLHIGSLDKAQCEKLISLLKMK